MIRLTRRVGPLVVALSVLVLTGSPSPGQSSPDEQEMLAAYRKGESLKKAGNYAEAAREYERAIPPATRAYGAEHPNTATLMNDLAELYISLGRYTEAEPLAKRSLQIREAKLGQDHPAVAISLKLLAWLYWNTGRYAEAEPLLKRSLQSWETRVGQDHPEVATSLNNLAELCRAIGRYAEAEPLYRRSLHIREEKLGQDHPDVANSLNNLGLLYQAMGQYARAEPLYQRGLEIREAKLGKDHPDVALSLNGLADLYASLGRSDEAAAAAERERRAVRRHVARTLPVLAESEQLTFLRHTSEKPFHVAQSLGLARRREAGTAALSAGWVLNGKGVAQESLAQRALLARDSHDPATASLSQQLLAVRRDLAALTLAAPGPDRRSSAAVNSTS